MIQRNFKRKWKTGFIVLLAMIMGGNPHFLFGESVTLGQKTEAYASEPPFKLQGYFEAQSRLTLEEYVPTAGMYRVRFKLLDGKEIIALCKPADLGVAPPAATAPLSVQKTNSQEPVPQVASGKEDPAHEDFERFSFDAKGGSGTYFTDWHSSGAARSGPIGRAEIVSGGGRNGSKGLKVSPDEKDEGKGVTINVCVPALEKQEISFWIRKEGDLKLRMDAFLYNGVRSGVELMHVILQYASIDVVHGKVKLPPDTGEWVRVVMVMDHKASKIKVSALEFTDTFTPEPWKLPAEGRYRLLLIANYGIRWSGGDAVIFDDFMCVPGRSSDGTPP